LKTETIQELCVGICACSAWWHGKLEGREFVLKHAKDGPIDPPIRVKITEISIPEDGHHLQACADLGCHMFLDIGINSRKVITWLTIVSFFTPTRARFGPVSISRLWRRRRPASVATIFKGIKQLTGKLKGAEISPWFSRKQFPFP
jgi:hypothetical protein